MNPRVFRTIQVTTMRLSQLVHSPLVPGHHADNQGNGGHGHRHNGADGHHLAVDVLHDAGKPVPDGLRQYRPHRQEQPAAHGHQRPVDRPQPGRMRFTFHFTTSNLKIRAAKKPPSDLSEERPSLCPLCDNTSILFSRSLVIGGDLPLFCHFVGRSFPFHSPTTPSSRSISPTCTTHRRTAITLMAWSRNR